MGDYKEAWKAPFFTVVFIFLGLFFYTKLAGPIPFFVNSVSTNQASLFSAEGTGEATSVPKNARFQVGVTKTAISPDEASEQTNKLANQIISDLRSLGIEEKDIKTIDYSVNPQYRFPEGEASNISGYNVTQILEVKTENVELAGKAIDVSVDSGANLVSGLSFDFTEEERFELENKARKEAIDEAKKKAESIAKVSGIKLGRIINIEENLGGVPLPLRTAQGAPAEDKSSSEILPGKSKVSISVRVYYEIR